MMNFLNRSIISIRDFDKESIEFVLFKSKELKQGLHKSCFNDKVLATLFFEPSTRTRLSFESAACRSGGKAIGFAEAGISSVKKGESFRDTVKTVEGYCDVIAIRHKLEGTSRLAADISAVPVVNAGDGANQHPTQTFLDLFTIQEEMGRLEGLKIGLMGDLKYGRTVHSLALGMRLFNSKLFFISHPLLPMPRSFLQELDEQNIEYTEVNELEEIDEQLDILYVTRIQQERFGDPMEYEKVAGSYRITLQSLDILGQQVKIMHPLPRVNEIVEQVDHSPNALYFQQAHNGIPVRQALLGLVTGGIR
jgi:aspartate carbamoyltransferase catalytic subunit